LPASFYVSFKLTTFPQQRLKRYERETASPREARKDKSPPSKKKETIVEEAAGFHSGSEEGEIEED
jgi:hypothetical protein